MLDSTELPAEGSESTASLADDLISAADRSIRVIDAGIDAAIGNGVHVASARLRIRISFAGIIWIVLGEGGCQSSKGKHIRVRLGPWLR